MSVSIAPGDIEFTVMPRLPNKTAFGRRISWNAVEIDTTGFSNLRSQFLRHKAQALHLHVELLVE